MSINIPANVESLILIATNPLNKEEDPNIVQSICQSVCSEAGGVQSALRLIVHKIQSPQEKEAMQALLILQACVNNCGATFHTEIGKFRFLNELIKLVSPKYLGNQTNLSVKAKVIELLYTWTIDLKGETKIAEAYSMLKKQNVVKDDPSYLGLQSSVVSKPKLISPSFEDEEKSRTLQRLLQSKRPEDVNKANALIKSMVKDDERRSERVSRRTVEVESVLNNVTVLNEMLNNYQAGQTISKSDLELMEELNNSCSSLCTNIYRIVSEMDDKEEGIGDLLKANDELSRVMGRYKLMTREMKKEQGGSISGAVPILSNGEKRDSRSSVDEEPLLDLNLLGVSPENLSDQRCSIDLDQINLGDSIPIPVVNNPVDLESKASSEESHSKSLSDLDDIFSSSVPPVNLVQVDLTLPVSMPQPLVPFKSESVKCNETTKPRNPLADLDILGSSMLLGSLPSHVSPMGSQFKPQEKVSLNQIRSQIREPESFISMESSVVGLNNLALANDDTFLITQPMQINEIAATSVAVSSSLSNLLNPSVSSKPRKPVVVEKTDNSLLIAENSDLIDVDLLASVVNTANLDNRLHDVDHEKNKEKETVLKKAQLCQAKTLNDIKVSLENIKPGNQCPLRLIDSGGMSTTLHFTENHPREDVSVVVVSTTSQNSGGITDYILQAVGPKGCKIRLLPPSNTEMPPFSPFLPPPAITQIMLIANPNQLNVSLKLMLSYSINDESVAEMGELESLPL